MCDLEMEKKLQEAYKKWCEALPCKPTMSYEEWKRVMADRYNRKKNAKP